MRYAIARTRPHPRRAYIVPGHGAHLVFVEHIVIADQFTAPAESPSPEVPSEKTSGKIMRGSCMNRIEMARTDVVIQDAKSRSWATV